MVPGDICSELKCNGIINSLVDKKLLYFLVVIDTNMKQLEKKQRNSLSFHWQQ
jgi:hypothetical protein